MVTLEPDGSLIRTNLGHTLIEHFLLQSYVLYIYFHAYIHLRFKHAVLDTG